MNENKDMTNGGLPQFQNSVGVKLDYIQRDVSKIQSDITIIKNDFVSRREYNEGLSDIKTQIDPVKNYSSDKARVWVAITVLMLLGGTIITLSIMAINSKIKEGISEALSQYQIEVK